ncbi:MAG: hypothetical protein U9R01_04720 [candidate division WOR-3 bacterium]|nr:hypothetical protein [candidate division WOR-3 bacterium]
MGMDDAEVVDSDDGAFFEYGRRADIIKDGRKIGVFGELHPEVITNFGLDHPVIGFEMKVWARGFDTDNRTRAPSKDFAYLSSTVAITFVLDKIRFVYLLYLYLLLILFTMKIVIDTISTIFPISVIAGTGTCGIGSD